MAYMYHNFNVATLYRNVFRLGTFHITVVLNNDKELMKAGNFSLYEMCISWTRYGMIGLRSIVVKY